MNFLLSIKNYLETLDQKEFKKYILIFTAFLLVIIGSLIFYYYYSIAGLKKRIATINKNRTTVSELIGRYNLVKKQQAEVDLILAKEKDFKISQYFEQLLEKLNLTQNKTQDVETMSEEVLDGAYTEWILYANLTNLNTKKMSELLHAIELEERIYTKEVEIDRSSNPSAINVKLTIATLEPKTETPKEGEG